MGRRRQGKIKIAAMLMPFAGITFLWFIGVVRDGFGRFEDKFFSTVFIGSGLLFLAMIFASSAVGAGLVASRTSPTTPRAHASRRVRPGAADDADATPTRCGWAAVFMISLATIWLKTGLMPRWLVVVTYLVALGLLIASDISMWIALAFPVWVLVVSLLVLVRAGVIDLHHDDDDYITRGAAPSRTNLDRLAGVVLLGLAGTSSASRTTMPSSSGSNSSSETITQLPDAMQASRSASTFIESSPPHRQ